jgi:hypothetical protein
MFALHMQACGDDRTAGRRWPTRKCCRSPTVNNKNLFMTGPATKKMTRAQRREFKKLTSRIDKVTQADARFFERFPHRQHRVRVAARAEIEQNALPDIPHDFSYFMAVKNVAPGARVRLLIIGLEGSDTDISEESARAIYEMARTPEAEQVEQQLAGLRL